MSRPSSAAAAVILGLATLGSAVPASSATHATVTSSDVSTVSSATSPSRADAPTPQRRQSLQAGLRAALARPSYPQDLEPPFSDLQAGMGKYFREGQQCLSPAVIGKATNCVVGPRDAAHTAVVFGDSIAVSYLAGIVDALGRDWQVHGVALSSCPAADVQMYLEYSPSDQRRCNRSHGKVYAAVDRFDPELVVVADSSAGIQRLKSGKRKEAAIPEWRAGMTRALRAVKAPGRRVVVLAPNPLGPDPADCYRPSGNPDECESTPEYYYYTKRRADMAAARATGATYVGTLDWYCYRARCPVFGLGLSMRWDGSHITAGWSRMLADRFRTVLLPPGT